LIDIVGFTVKGTRSNLPILQGDTMSTTTLRHSRHWTPFSRDGREPLINRPRGSAALHRWYATFDRRRELTRLELEGLVDDLAGRPELWRPLIHHSAEERYYAKLQGDDHVEIWLLCWCASQETGFHDHAGSRGAVAVVEGLLTERLLSVDGRNPMTTHPVGSRFSFGATHIHDVQHAAGAPASSLHAYSPPLGPMGFYDLRPDGSLTRRAGDYREEFC
jgi:hypothetical protein